MGEKFPKKWKIFTHTFLWVKNFQKYFSENFPDFEKKNNLWKISKKNFFFWKFFTHRNVWVKNFQKNGKFSPIHLYGWKFSKNIFLFFVKIFQSENFPLTAKLGMQKLHGMILCKSLCFPHFLPNFLQTYKETKNVDESTVLRNIIDSIINVHNMRKMKKSNVLCSESNQITHQDKDN